MGSLWGSTAEPWAMGGGLEGPQSIPLMAPHV